MSCREDREAEDRKDEREMLILILGTLVLVLALFLMGFFGLVPRHGPNETAELHVLREFFWTLEIRLAWILGIAWNAGVLGYILRGRGRA